MPDLEVKLCLLRIVHAQKKNVRITVNAKNAFLTTKKEMNCLTAQGSKSYG